MIRTKKLNANRANAGASTGPKTSQGKIRSARNAWRHGLSLSVGANPLYTVYVEKLALEITGEGANPEIIELGRRVAEAQIDVMRVRQARHDLFVEKMDDPTYAPKALLRGTRKKARILRRLARTFGPLMPLPRFLLDGFSIKLEGPKKSVAVLSEISKELSALNRYERRAMSRRKFAIRALNAARGQLTDRGADAPPDRNMFQRKLFFLAKRTQLTDVAVSVYCQSVESDCPADEFKLG